MARRAGELLRPATDFGRTVRVERWHRLLRARGGCWLTLCGRVLPWDTTETLIADGPELRPAALCRECDR